MRPGTWMMLMLGLAACAGGDDTGGRAGPGTGDPADGFAAFTVAPAPECGLVAEVAVDLDAAAPLTVSIDGPGLSRTLTLPAATHHEARLLELRAESAYTVTVATETAERTATFETAALPAELPPITVRVSDPDRMQPGLTVVPLSRWTPVAEIDWGWLVALDAAGEVVWYRDLGSLAGAFTVADGPDGAPLLYTTDWGLAAWEVSPASGAVRELTTETMGLDSVHHEVRPWGDGLALLSTELREVGGFPDDATYNVVGDVLVETDWSGRVTWRVDLMDLIDPPSLYTDDMDNDFWAVGPYAGFDSPQDWSHGNAMSPDPDHDAWIASFRNLDRVLSIDRATGTLNWSLGPGGDFALAEGSRWFTRQHAAQLTERGTLLMYDNGNIGAGMGIPTSRVVEYALDLEAMTAAEVWSWSGTDPYFSPIVGNLEALDNGNHLVTDGTVFGGFTDLGGGQTAPHFSGRVREIVGTEAPEVVFEAAFGYPEDAQQDGISIYRSYRVDSLYPD